MFDKFPISQKGYNKLIIKLKKMKTIERLEVAEAIFKARSHGDLSENAEYNAAKENQSFIEAKISKLEDNIARTKIINVAKIFNNKIKYGALIKLLDVNLKKKIIYKLNLSITSPPASQECGHEDL